LIERPEALADPVLEYIPSRPVVSVRSILTGQRIFFPPPGLFSFARYALIYYLQYLSSLRKEPVRRVLLPDHMCHEVANSLREYGYEVGYYALGENFHVAEKAVEEALTNDPGYKVILLGHFYGRICRNLESIIRLCRDRGVTVVEDCVHLPFPYHASFTGSDADAKLYTHRKVYPIPYGATLVLREGQDRFDRFVRATVPKRYRGGIGEAFDWAWKQVIKRGLQLTGQGYRLPYRDLSNDPLKPFNYACPGVAGLLSMRNLHDAVVRRRRNYETYLEHRSIWASWGRVLEFDVKTDVPYMFVLFLDDAFDALTTVQSLMKRSIPAVPGLALDECVRARLPRKHDYHKIITLPLHQDIHEGHIRYIAHVLSSGRLPS
jgi:hypothetical protein